ncbi:MAG: cytidylate kinase-like family protein [Bacteroidales bacterium]|nr:cytidylate kinase-like family protein [Bacteroidales bacterium]
MDKKIIINIGRQFGSGGKSVAIALGQKLGIPVYDNELLIQAAKESGYSEDFFAKRDEQKKFFSLSNLTSTLVNSFGIAENYLNDDELFRIQSEVIKGAAERGSAIFVGRASDYVLRDLDCLDVFITAPMAARKARVAERTGVSLEEAEAIIQKRDKTRKSYYDYFTFGDWGVASNYDLCLDSSMLGIDGTADFIIEFGKKSGLI